MNMKTEYILDNGSKIIGNGNEGAAFVNSLMSNNNDFNDFQKALHKVSLSLGYQGYKQYGVNKYKKLSVYKDFTFDVKVGDLFLSEYEYSQTIFQWFFSLFGKDERNVKLSLYKIKDVYLTHYPMGFTKYQQEIDVEYVRKIKLVQVCEYNKYSFKLNDV